MCALTSQTCCQLVLSCTYLHMTWKCNENEFYDRLRPHNYTFEHECMRKSLQFCFLLSTKIGSSISILRPLCFQLFAFSIMLRDKIEKLKLNGSVERCACWENSIFSWKKAIFKNHNFTKHLVKKINPTLVRWMHRIKSGFFLYFVFANHVILWLL